MSLFNQACSSCGKPTRKKHIDGRPLCGDCWSLELQENAKAEEKRACPDDGATLAKDIVQDAFIIDRCPSCGGVWLDGDDIELLKDLIAIDKVIPESERLPSAVAIHGIVRQSE